MPLTLLCPRHLASLGNFSTMKQMEPHSWAYWFLVSIQIQVKLCKFMESTYGLYILLTYFSLLSDQPFYLYVCTCLCTCICMPSFCMFKVFFLNSVRYDPVGNQFFPMPTNKNEGYICSLFLCLCFGEHFQILISNIDMYSEYLFYCIVTQQGSSMLFIGPVSTQQKPRINILVQLLFCLDRKGEFCGLQQIDFISISLDKKLYNRIFFEIL